MYDATGITQKNYKSKVAKIIADAVLDDNYFKIYFPQKKELKKFSKTVHYSTKYIFKLVDLQKKIHSTTLLLNHKIDW